MHWFPRLLTNHACLFQSWALCHSQILILRANHCHNYKTTLLDVKSFKIKEIIIKSNGFSIKKWLSRWHNMLLFPIVLTLYICSLISMCCFMFNFRVALIYYLFYLFIFGFVVLPCSVFVYFQCWRFIVWLYISMFMLIAIVLLFDLYDVLYLFLALFALFHSVVDFIPFV